MTDEDALVMKHKDGTSKPSYNQQSAVDEKYGVTTAVRTSLWGDKPEDLEVIVDASNAIRFGRLSSRRGWELSVSGRRADAVRLDNRRRSSCLYVLQQALQCRG